MADFYDERIHKARKQHGCSLCGKKIQKGDEYSRATGVWQGDFFSESYHSRCLKLVHSVLDEAGENEFDQDYIYEWIGDSICAYCGEREDCVIDKVYCLNVLKRHGLVEPPEED